MDHPLLKFDNVIASPHTAGVTKEARANMGKIAAEQVIVALDGKRPPRIVNPQVWPTYAKRFEQTFGIRPEYAAKIANRGEFWGTPCAGWRRRETRGQKQWLEDPEAAANSCSST